MAQHKKKIAVVIPKYGLAGGAEQFVLEQTERLALSQKYEIHVFANKWKVHSANITFHKVPIISFPKFLTTVSFAFFANQLINKLKFDLIHTHDRIFKADIFTMHGTPHRIWVKEIRKKTMSLFDLGTSWVEKKLVTSERCKFFLSVSNLAKQQFLKEYSTQASKLIINHPGVDINRFHNQPNALIRQKIRNKYNISNNDTVILFVSMNFEHKGLDTLLSALSLLRNKPRSKKLKLLVAGKGNYKKFKKIADQLNVHDQIVFTGLWEKGIEQLYFSSDFFVMLSKFDTFGIAVLEAMAASLPVIISNQVGAKDILSEGINGYIIENNSVETLCKKISILLDDNIRKQMAQQAQQTASGNTWSQSAKQVSKLYEQFITNNSTGL